MCLVGVFILLQKNGQCFRKSKLPVQQAPTGKKNRTGQLVKGSITSRNNNLFAKIAQIAINN